MYLKASFLILIFFINLHANWKTPRENLDNLYQDGYFRVFYTLKGENALPENKREDLNKNKVPDYIENIAQRLRVTKDIFTEILGFQDPLKSKRYSDVKYVDVHILKSKYSSSGDAKVTYKYKILDTKEKVLSMMIRNDLSKDTLTPSHEYFHLLQNSYTMFKNRWYTEGTARWSEWVFRRGEPDKQALPSTIKQLNTLLKKTYDAKGFWQSITFICDTNNAIFENKSNINTNLINYPSLVDDDKTYGYKFMKKFFENLDIQDNIASQKRGFKEFSWSEKEQKYNENNNKYILKALIDTINTTCPKKDKLINFQTLLNKYINEE